MSLLFMMMMYIVYAVAASAFIAQLAGEAFAPFLGQDTDQESVTSASFTVGSTWWLGGERIMVDETRANGLTYRTLTGRSTGTLPAKQWGLLSKA